MEKFVFIECKKFLVDFNRMSFGSTKYYKSTTGILKTGTRLGFGYNKILYGFWFEKYQLYNTNKINAKHFKCTRIDFNGST